MIPIVQGKLTLISKETVARATLKMHFKVEAWETLNKSKQGTGIFNFAPGQFISIGFTKKAWRAYSIASLPGDQYIELVVRLVEGGVGSKAFDKAVVGDPFDFKAPFGHFQLSENKHPLVFCATGTGIAPIRAMILAENKSENPRAMVCLYGGRDINDIAYLDEIMAWSPKLKVCLGFSRKKPEKIPPKLQEATIENHRITEFIKPHIIPENSEFYICGNGNMVISVTEALEAQGLHKDKIFMERFN